MGLSKKSASTLSQIGLIYAAFTWGTTFVVVKDSLKNIDPVILVGYRFLLSALLLGLFLFIQKRNLFAHLKHGVILGILLWFLYAPQTIGLKYTSAANSVLITGLFVAFVPVFSYLLYGQKSTLWQVGAAVISLLGFWFLTGGLSSVNIGDVMTVITAMAYALHILVADHFIKKNGDPIILSFQQFFVVGLLSIIIGLLFHLPLQVGSTQTMGVILFLTLVPGLSAFVIQLLAQKHVTPVKVALIFALEPVFGTITAWTVGGEHFMLLHGLGGLLIILAIIFPEIPKLLASNKAS